MKNSCFITATGAKKALAATAGAKSAFTLAEMLMVLLIVSILAAATLPIMTKKTKARTQPVVQTPIGAVMLYAGKEVPDGWLECDGKNIASRPKYAKLREALGKDTIPLLGGMPTVESSNNQQNIMEEMRAMLQDNEEMSQEEALKLIAEKHKESGAQTEGMVKWIIRAE